MERELARLAAAFGGNLESYGPHPTIDAYEAVFRYGDSFWAYVLTQDDLHSPVPLINALAEGLTRLKNRAR